MTAIDHSISILIVILIYYSINVFAQTTTTPLSNNQILSNSIAAGKYNYYYFSIPAQNRLFSRGVLPNIYLSTSTCSQPRPPSTFHDVVPSINMYISTSADNTLPGPDNGIAVDDSLNGLSTWSSNNSATQIWIAVGATSLPNTWTGNWTYEIGVSTSQIMHPIWINEAQDSSSPYFTLEDTDKTNALFTSSPFASGSQAPNSTIIMTTNLPNELSFSICAAKSYSIPNYSVNTTLTNRGLLYNNVTRQQFMVSNLTTSTSYAAYMVQTVNGVQGLTTPIRLSTKIDANCRLIYDLPFCDQVAYSVPANPDAQLSNWDIANQYDQQALTTFQPFGTALSQYNCETTQYSLVRNCTDCYRDYKTWLCAVTIPRCTDSSTSADLSQGTDNVPAAPALRDISVNASRNPWVDSQMKPGEWTELLPCIDLCYHVVQSCPPFLQFYCPDADLATVQYGYWQNGSATVNGTVFHFDINHPTCNRMAVDPSLLTLSGASHLASSSITLISSCIVLLLLLV